MFSVTYARVKDFYLSQSYQSPDTLLLLKKTFNTDFTETLAFFTSIPLSIGKWYRGTYNFSLFNNHIKTDDWFGQHFDRNKWSYIITTIHNFTISTTPHIVLSMETLCRNKAYMGVWTYSGRWYINSSVKWQFDHSRATLRLACNDIFETFNKPKYTIELLNQNQNIWENRNTRNISLTFTYQLKGYKDKRMNKGDTSRFGL